jgi:hypothetical protein
VIELLVQRLFRPLPGTQVQQQAGQAETSSAKSAAGPDRLQLLFLRVARPLLLSALVVSACSGDNLFSGESSAVRPTANIFAPSIVVSGDTFQVQVFAEAVRGITRIDVGLIGAFFMDTTMFVNGSAINATPVFRFRAPDVFFGDALVVQARVIDRRGLSSAITADTAIAIAR